MTPAPHYSNKQVEEAANILNLTAAGLAQILRESTPKEAAENVADHVDEDNERNGSVGEVCNTNDYDAGHEELERPSVSPRFVWGEACAGLLIISSSHPLILLPLSTTMVLDSISRASFSLDMITSKLQSI